MCLRFLLLVVLMLSLSSCLNQAINVARSPGAVANAVVADTAQGIVGDDLGTLFSESKTSEHIEQALRDNPDALNGQELRKLREEMDSHNMGANGQGGVSSGTGRQKYYDRRAGAEFTGTRYRVDHQTGMVYDTHEYGILNAPRVPLENELPADRLLRSRDDWRFGLPKQTNLRVHKTKQVKYIKPYQPKIMSAEEFMNKKGIELPKKD